MNKYENVSITINQDYIIEGAPANWPVEQFIHVSVCHERTLARESQIAKVFPLDEREKAVTWANEQGERIAKQFKGLGFQAY